LFPTYVACDGIFFQFAIEMIKLLPVMLFLNCANAIAYDASLTEQM
jgi:hypothetical protein